MKLFLRKIRVHYQLYLLFLPTLAYFVIFQYIPMYGVQIAFKDFLATRELSEVLGSVWNTSSVFNSFQFWTLIKNTLGLSLYGLALGFPIPILLALLLNQLSSHRFKRFVQTVTYAPHFVSTVVIVGMLTIFLSPQRIDQSFYRWFGRDPVFFSARRNGSRHCMFFLVYGRGRLGAIIYLAALAGVDPGLHEAAIIDGATKLQRIRYIDIPSILPTIIIVLILQLGSIMTVGFEKTF